MKQIYIKYCLFNTFVLNRISKNEFKRQNYHRIRIAKYSP